MSINLQGTDKSNSPINNFISNIDRVNSKLSHKCDNLEKNIEFQKNLNIFFSPDSSNISISNNFLCDSINWANYSNFTYALFNPVNFNLKIFASNALLYLFTNNYTEIEIEKVKGIFDSLINYLLEHCNELYQQTIHINNNFQNINKYENEPNNQKIFMNSLIKLLARIIRVFYPQCNYFKSFHSIVSSRSLAYNSNSNIIKIVINIFTEVIYQFQTNFGLNKNTIEMTKYFGTLEEFKENSLIQIFNYTCDTIAHIVEHKIPTDNFTDILQMSKQIVLCLQECLDYSEDSNIKEEDYNKYEIKPTFIPNPRRRGKDKKLNIVFLLGLCQNLFDLYNMIVKTYISFNNGNNDSNTNEVNLEYYYISEGVLKILNSLVCMKIQYLDINKGRILKNYTSNLGGILINKYGYIHHEYLCQIIYRLKKNYNYIDLTIGNETFWSLVLPYIENSINLIGNKGDKSNIILLESIKNNFISSSHAYLSGSLYLLQFLGYFSHNLYKIPLNYQIKLKQFILSICSKMLEMNFNEYESDMEDICKCFGACAEGIYIQILEDLIKYINNDYKKIDIINLCFKIKFGIETLKNNYQYIQEQRLINKLSYSELECFSEIDLSDDKPEVNAILNFIKCIFNIIDEIIYGKNKNFLDNINIINLGILSNTLLKFVKFFCKHFLSKYLNNSLTFLINSLLNDDNSKEEKTPEDLIVFIFNILIAFNIKNEKKNNINNINNNVSQNINNFSSDEKFINQKIVLEILNILYDNFTFESDYSNKICQFQTLDILNNNSLIDEKILISNENNENDNGNEIISNFSSSSNKNNSSYESLMISTPRVKSSSLLNSESIENLSKYSFSQKIQKHHGSKNNQTNKSNNLKTNLEIINEKDEININSVEIHLGKIRLCQDKFINILKDLFNKIISMNSESLSLKTKKHFIEFLFKIVFQCYIPFEAAINYFIDILTKINAKDIREYIYIISAMISSVTTQENYQILIETILPSIGNLCNSIISQTFSYNNFNNGSLIFLKKILKLIKDITNLEKCHIRAFTNKSQTPIHIFSLVGNLLEYFISLANNINISNMSEHKVYLIQIKPISYIVQIYYNLFTYYIQVPLFINTNYTYMKNYFHKISKIIFSINMKNLIGYCGKFKQLMKLLKVIYCDYIIQNYVLINNINNNILENNEEFICDINFIPNIILLCKYILNEDYLETSDSITNGNNNNIGENKEDTNNDKKLNISPITKSGENIRECFKDFNDIIYEWCKLYIQYKKYNISVYNNAENKENSQNNNNLLLNNKINTNNINNNPTDINIKILFYIFNKNNINSLLYDILKPILIGIILNYYNISEIYNSLSKSVFILAYSFNKEFKSILDSILTSNKIKHFYSEEEINIIKSNLEQLDNVISNNTSGNINNNLNGVIASCYNIFREKLNEFAKKIQNIIISRKMDIDDKNNFILYDEDMIDF